MKPKCIVSLTGIQILQARAHTHTHTHAHMHPHTHKHTYAREVGHLGM